MTLGKHLGNCDELWKETRDLLAEENLTNIQSDIQELGDKWDSWKDKNEKTIIDFCLATSKQKAEILNKCNNEETRGRILFAALQKHTDGINLLLTLKLYGIEDPLSQGSAQLLETAGSALDSLLRLQYLSEPNDIFSFDLSSPLESAEAQLKKLSTQST